MYIESYKKKYRRNKMAVRIIPVSEMRQKFKEVLESLEETREPKMHYNA